MSFYFFGGISIKVSGVDVGFVERVIRMGSEGVKKLLKFTFVRKDIHASQVDYIVVEWRRQRPCNRLVGEGEVPLLWVFPCGCRDVQLSSRIEFTAPLSECIAIEKHVLLRVRSDSPPL